MHKYQFPAVAHTVASPGGLPLAALWCNPPKSPMPLGGSPPGAFHHARRVWHVIWRVYNLRLQRQALVSAWGANPRRSKLHYRGPNWPRCVFGRWGSKGCLVSARLALADSFFDYLSGDTGPTR